MELNFNFWYLILISIDIATIFMSSDIGGDVFLFPLSMLWLKFEPRVAIGTALANELCGFSSDQLKGSGHLKFTLNSA